MSGRRNQNRKRFARLKRQASFAGGYQQKTLSTDQDALPQQPIMQQYIDQSLKTEACLSEVKTDYAPQTTIEMLAKEDSTGYNEEKIASDVVDTILAELSLLPKSSSLLENFLNTPNNSTQQLLPADIDYRKSTLSTSAKELLLFCENKLRQSTSSESLPKNVSVGAVDDVTSTSVSMSGYLPDDEHNCKSSGCIATTTLTSSSDHAVDSYSNSISPRSTGRNFDYPRNCQLDLSTTSSEYESSSTKSYSSESMTLSTSTYFTTRSRSLSSENTYHSAENSVSPSSKSTSSA